MFGKRTKPPGTEQPTEPTQPAQGPETSAAGSGVGPGDTSLGDSGFPWSGDPSFVACNLAAGNLANNLAAWMEHEGRVHAETYVAASGAIAGYAAQRTFLAQHGSALPPGMQTATTKSGDQYLFGDPLNDMLLAKNEAEADARVWSRAVGAALSTGLPMARVPKLDDMFGHVAGSLGSPQEGLPSTGPNHQPMAPVRQLLSRCWPQVSRLFAADFDEFHRSFGPVPPAWWCAIAAFATSRPIIDVGEVLNPAISLTILMESAIYASKLTRF